MLGRLEGGAPDDPTDLTLVLPPVGQQDAPRATVLLPRDEIPDGRWLVRVQVDGVDSLPAIVGDDVRRARPDPPTAVTAIADAGWETANRDLLMAELGVVRALLRTAAGDGTPAQVDDARLEAIAARNALTGPSALDEVATGFGLSTFERSVLLLAAGPELAAATADEIAAAGGDPRPTFGLALSVLPERALGRPDAAVAAAPMGPGAAGRRDRRRRAARS